MAESQVRDEHPFPSADDSSAQPLRKPLLLQNHPYKYDVVNSPADEAICPVCLDLAIQPFLVECCGHHFCQQCLTNVRAKGIVCPLCRKNTPTAMHDKYFERNVIHKLQVRCSEKENGCQWEGILVELEHHLTQCQYVKENCPYKCGDRVQRHHLEEHKAKLCPQRSFDCGYCDYCGTYREVTDQHWSLCELFPLACPNDCGTMNIPRGELQEHCSSKCPLQEVACDFSHAGCKVQLVRRDLAQHMSDAAQQHVALVSLTLLQDKEREIAQLKQQLREKEHLEQHREKAAKKEQEMARKEQDTAKKYIELKAEMEVIDKKFKEVLDRMSQLEDLIRDQMEKTCSIHSVLGADCNFTLTDYQEKRKKSVDWYSPPFYTKAHGYKMCMKVEMGSRHNKLYIYSYLLPGEYDASLKWPFRGTVVVRLLNQLSDDNHYDYVFDYSRASDSQSQRVTSGERSNWKSPSTNHLIITVLDYNFTKKCQYLKNDCLMFKITVSNV